MIHHPMARPARMPRRAPDGSACSAARPSVRFVRRSSRPTLCRFLVLLGTMLFSAAGLLVLVYRSDNEKQAIPVAVAQTAPTVCDPTRKAPSSILRGAQASVVLPVCRTLDSAKGELKNASSLYRRAIQATHSDADIKSVLRLLEEALSSAAAAQSSLEDIAPDQSRSEPARTEIRRLLHAVQQLRNDILKAMPFG